MLLHNGHVTSRRGIFVVKMAILMIPLLILMALAIDSGWMAATRTQLHCTSDASATAGVSVLLDRDELTGMPNQTAEIAAARALARNTSLANKAGKVVLDLDENATNDPNGDIVVGYLANPNDLSAPLQFNTGTPPIHQSPLLLWVPPVSNPSLPIINPPPVNNEYRSYNSVQVRSSRTNKRNGSLSLFFGQFAGRGNIELDTVSVATYEDNIKGFKIYPNGPPTSKLVPFAMEVNTFAAMAAGLSTLDLFVYDPKAPVTPAKYPGNPPTPPDYSERVSFAHALIDPTHANSLLKSKYLNPVAPGLLFGFKINSEFWPPKFFDQSDALSSLLNIGAGDGIKEALLIPNIIQTKLPLLGGDAVSLGNFGTLFIGTDENTPLEEFQRQILYGPNAADFAKMGGVLQLGDDGTLKMKGDSLIAATLKQTLGSIRGQPRIIPLYKPTDNGLLPHIIGEGVDYTIVGFGGITFLEILELNDLPALPAITNPLTGEVLIPAVPAGTKTLRLFVQPEFVIDATAIGGGSTLNNGGARTSRFVYRPLRLSR